MPKLKPPSRKSLRAALLEALFDPREPGLAAVLVGMNDPQYLTKRVLEELSYDPMTELRLDRCIGLLALAKLLMRGRAIDIARL